MRRENSSNILSTEYSLKSEFSNRVQWVALTLAVIFVTVSILRGTASDSCWVVYGAFSDKYQIVFTARPFLLKLGNCIFHNFSCSDNLHPPTFSTSHYRLEPSNLNNSPNKNAPEDGLLKSETC